MTTGSSTAQPIISEATKAVLRKASWRIVPLFVACFVMSYLDRVNVSFAKLQMQSELGLSEAAYGFGASIFFVGYLLFEVPSNIILAKVGSRRWIARIMISWGIASAAMMFVRSETVFYLLRFLLGVLEAGFRAGRRLLLHTLVSSQPAGPYQLLVLHVHRALRTDSAAQSPAPL